MRVGTGRHLRLREELHLPAARQLATAEPPPAAMSQQTRETVGGAAYLTSAHTRPNQERTTRAKHRLSAAFSFPLSEFDCSKSMKVARKPHGNVGGRPRRVVRPDTQRELRSSMNKERRIKDCALLVLERCHWRIVRLAGSACFPPCVASIPYYMCQGFRLGFRGVPVSQQGFPGVETLKMMVIAYQI